MGRSTTKGYFRAHGGNVADGASPAVIPVVLAIRGLDATVDAGTLTGKFIPKGAIPLSVAVVESVAAAGGTAPILDIGLELATPDDNGLADGLAYDATTNTQIADALAGVLLGTELAETAEVTYGDDGVGVNNTSGEIDIFITYTFDDDGTVNN